MIYNDAHLRNIWHNLHAKPGHDVKEKEIFKTYLTGDYIFVVARRDVQFASFIRHLFTSLNSEITERKCFTRTEEILNNFYNVTDINSTSSYELNERFLSTTESLELSEFFRVQWTSLSQRGKVFCSNFFFQRIINYLCLLM